MPSTSLSRHPPTSSLQPTALTKIFISAVISAIALNAFLLVPCQGVNSPPQISLTVALTKGRTIAFSEDKAVQALIGLLEITDNDRGLAGEVSCRSESNYVELVLAANKFYKILLKNPLDREVSNLVDVIILCTDEGSPPLSQTERFSIEVLDANDNSPKFTQEAYTFTVMENDRPNIEIGQVSAVDLDLGDNAVVSFSLKDENGNDPAHFKINEKNGTITCTSTMDREKVEEIILYAHSNDHGIEPLQNEAEVRIKIIDVNDNTPTIIKRNFSVKEGLAPMTHFGTLEAGDLDDGLNGQVEFTLVFDRDGASIPPFYVKPNGDIVAAVPLDRESLDKYVIQVAVADLGAPSLSSTANIYIDVVDVNDNRPIITAPKELDEYDFDYSINSSDYVVIDWHTPSDSKLVYQVLAVDHDMDENGRLYYTIESINSDPIDDDSLFEIKEDTGRVFLHRSVRREDDPVQIITFLVHDGGKPSLSATVSLNVTINVDFDTITPPPLTDPGIPQKGPGGSASRMHNVGGLSCLIGYCLFHFMFHILNTCFVV